MHTQARARVQVTIDVDAGAHYDEKASVDRVHKSALESTMRNLRSKLRDAGLEIVGEPKVKFITHEIRS